MQRTVRVVSGVVGLLLWAAVGQAQNTTVQDVVLSWTAPTTNIDGTPLTDLAGFVVYWRLQGVGTWSKLTIPDPAATTRTLTSGLVPGMTEFTVTAYDTSNNESAPAPIALLVIPTVVDPAPAPPDSVVCSGRYNIPSGQQFTATCAPIQ